ncbi:MAG: hypothetical protein LBT59_08685 [Clostridiales bacterium]|jgi:hypothetical protein|nr:hypothetical protein [Clostridiales bacterium]
MSTRALYGFKRNGVEKISSCESDGYPWSLGVQMLTFCRNSNPEEIGRLFDKIEMVPFGESIDGKELLDLPWDLVSMSQRSEEWYMNSYDYEDDLNYLYSYIINLDTERLERWDMDLDTDFFPASPSEEVNLRDLAEIDNAITKWNS